MVFQGIKDDLKDSEDRSDNTIPLTLSIIIHELRNPLNTIKGFSELLFDNYLGELSKDQRDAVEKILKAANFMMNLINQLLDISKITRGAMELAKELADIYELICEVLEFYRVLAKKKNIKLMLINEDSGEVFSKEKPISYNVTLDKIRMKEIMMNLISNAVKFTDEGGKIEVRVSTAGEHVKISVKDNGVGMDSEQIKNLFTPFYQLDNAYTMKHKGTGLGLYLTKLLVDLHGGDISVSSQKGQGSTFTITLPKNP